MVRRDMFEAYGGYDAALACCEDVDLFLRLARAGGFKFIDRDVLHYRVGAPSIMNELRTTATASSIAMVRESYRTMHARYKRNHGIVEYRALQALARALGSFCLLRPDGSLCLREALLRPERGETMTSKDPMTAEATADRTTVQTPAGAVTIQGNIFAKWRALGKVKSPDGDDEQAHLGPPLGEQSAVPARYGGGAEQLFRRGMIVERDDGTTYVVYGAIYDRYLAIGGTASALGQPISDEEDAAGGRVGRFQYGEIYWRADFGHRVVRGRHRGRYAARPSGGHDGWSTRPGRPSGGRGGWFTRPRRDPLPENVGRSRRGTLRIHSSRDDETPLPAGVTGRRSAMRELQFDGLVGPTHNYGGLSPGNVASTRHGGQTSNPRAAARRGLAKMRFVRGLGVAPGGAAAARPAEPRDPAPARLHAAPTRRSSPPPRPPGTASILRLCSSASAMWTANAATVAPSCDTGDARVHLTPANLQQMFHRAIEPPTTTRVLRAIFADAQPLRRARPAPGRRTARRRGGRQPHAPRDLARRRAPLRLGTQRLGSRSPARDAIPRGRRARPARPSRASTGSTPRAASFRSSTPTGSTPAPSTPTSSPSAAGASSCSTSSRSSTTRASWTDLRRALGDELVRGARHRRRAPARRAPSRRTRSTRRSSALDDGAMVIVAPEDSREDGTPARFLERVVGGGGPVRAVHYIDVRQSMHNGGGPACLRLRVPLTRRRGARARRPRASRRRPRRSPLRLGRPALPRPPGAAAISPIPRWPARA